jgi:3',5'-cyclic AMP phosphodiesterase CpdA
MNLSRRRLMQTSTAALLSAGLWPGRLFAEERETQNFSFIEVNDLHYMDAECGHFFEKVVAQMKATPGIDMVLIVGDVTDNGRPDQESTQRDIFDKLGVPYHVVPGNHDYLADDDRSGYDQFFGKSLNYTFDHKGWRFIALDTTDGTKYSNTTIQPATLQWLDENLPKLDKSQPTVVFTHFPMAPHTPYRPKNADALLERLKPINVQSIFDGHFHGFTESKINGAAVTTDKCCALKRWNHDGTKEKGYFLCRAKDGQITREFVEVNFPGMPPMPEGTKIVKPPQQS